MQLAARSYFAAGVALVGAGAIAVSPVAPPVPDLKVPPISSANVELSALANPFESYLALVTNTFANVQTAVGKELADPAPILQQIIANQVSSGQTLFGALQDVGDALGKQFDPSNQYSVPAQLQEAFSALTAGDINGAVSTAWGAVLGLALNAGLPILEPITQVIRQPVQNLLNVIDQPLAIVLPVLGVLGTAYAGVTVAGNVGQAIVDAAKTGDALGVASALVGGPALIADAIINGNGGSGGILGASGIVDTLRQARELIAGAITPEVDAPATVAAAAVAPAAKSVTLDVKTLQAPAAEPTPAASADEKDPATTESDTAKAEATSSSDDAATGSTAVVKESPKASPTKTTKAQRSSPAKAVRDSVRDSVKKATGGLKKSSDHKKSSSSSEHKKGAA